MLLDANNHADIGNIMSASLWRETVVVIMAASKACLGAALYCAGGRGLIGREFDVGI
jgi:hypothetical protein